MSRQDFHLKSLLSPARSGTFFAPFRSRSANPDGFDSKMKLWINAVEEWAVLNKKLTLSLKDIHQTFVSDSGIRPDKDCIRLVLSEMKRRSRLVSLDGIRSSKIFSTSTSIPILDSFIDPKGWLGWGVKNLVLTPANWAISNLVSSQDHTYSDLTDLSITDTTRFVCQRSLSELSQNLLNELIRISRAEKQFCFEWHHLFELITPIMNTIIDATDGKELLEMLDILIDYLAANHHLAVSVSSDSKLVKIANAEDPDEDQVTITQKDIAMARLLRAKELLTNDADKNLNRSQRAKLEALECYKRGELTKAKSLLRSHKRFNLCAEQKETQLTNVENMIDLLENTNSNKIIMKAYEDATDALRLANVEMDANRSMLDDVYDVTAEAKFLNDEMNQMLNNISLVSQSYQDTSNADLEAELNEYIQAKESDEKSLHPTSKTRTADQSNSVDKAAEAKIDDKFVDELEQRLNDLVVCQDEPIIHPKGESTPRSETSMPYLAS